jgi:hypothetical protein
LIDYRENSVDYSETVSASLVGGGGHHAAPVGGAAHDDRYAMILWMVALLDAGVKS